MNGHTWSVTLIPQKQGRVAVLPEPAESVPPTQRWLTVPQAARYLGLATPGGRAPTSTYEVAREIGSFVGNRWLIHSNDLDEWIRQQGRGRAP
jgi:Helix-turn-helix domain